MQNHFKDQAPAPVYLYRRNALYGMSYQILKNTGGDIVPVGEYALLNSDENQRVTEARLMNLVSLMNGKQTLLDTAKVAGKSLYFQVIPRSDAGRQQIIFRERGDTGVSSENAILSLDEGI